MLPARDQNLTSSNAGATLAKAQVDPIQIGLAEHASAVRRELAQHQIIGAAEARLRPSLQMAPLLDIDGLLGKLRTDPCNAITAVLSDRICAVGDMAASKASPAHPLAGLPFVAKDLFDVCGLPTTAGAKMRAEAMPAMHDAKLICMLEAAGAVLVGTANMDAFAYGFATDNEWLGRTLNPYDLERLAGGSSGGSAAAVAVGLVPFSLGSDTNGSVRVPASLCGIYGLKPTHGRLPSEGMFPFSATFDDPGLFTRSLACLRAVWQVVTGETDEGASAKLRAAPLGGWFDQGPQEVKDTFAAFCKAIGAADPIDWRAAEAARSGAFLITAAEGGALHQVELDRDLSQFDKAVGERLLAGARVPVRAYIEAHSLLLRERRRIDALFAGNDLLLTLATPGTAPRFDAPFVELSGQSFPARSHLGVFTQPISFLGLPSLAMPLRRPDLLPLGVQVIARPGREIDLFAFAGAAEQAGLVGFTPPRELGAH